MVVDTEQVASRNDLAEDRTLLASERTFAGWMRTSFASLEIGVGFHALFGELQPSWLPRAIATSFMMLAMAVVILAERRATAVLARLSPHVVVAMANHINKAFNEFESNEARDSKMKRSILSVNSINVLK